MQLLSRLLVCLTLISSFTAALSITSTNSWDIANDVEGSVRLNGLAFQQHALTTFGDYQYVAFYKTASGYGKHYVNLGRRRIAPSLGEWQYFAFTDYLQTTLDEHNTISMGISGDGKIHLSFDHHDVPLNYRVSNAGIAKTIPSEWTATAFGAVQHSLPGSTGPWTPLTYPRFERIDNGDLLMEFRIGQSGAGDSYIHRYSSTSGQWSNVGKYLQGEDNNAYINGFTNRAGKLFVSWTVRETPDASTNHDFYFALSEDAGRTWKQTNGQGVTKPITPSTAGIKVFAIPQNSEIINQEAQCADQKGRFHALMRDKSSGTSRFYHYLRTAEGKFTKTAINASGLSTPPYLAYRGKIAAAGDNVIAILPDQPKQTVQIWGATAGGGYTDWKKLAEITNMAGEPLVDEERLDKFGVLSLFVRQGGPFGTRKVQVWDYGLAL
ncbi:Nn.00g080740.m01.CDS01 [Neocucurbitaria sp. VM-36]